VCVHVHAHAGLALTLALDHEDDIRVQRGIEEASQCQRTLLRAGCGCVPGGLQPERINTAVHSLRRWILLVPFII